MTSFLAATFSLESGRRIARRLDAFHPRPLPVLDAAVVDWPNEDVKPSTWQARPMEDSRALSGAFWGHLFAHLVLLPLSHVEEPPTPDADDVEASLSHLGLNPRPLGALRAAITPGTVTIFLLHDDRGEPEAVAALGVGHLFRASVELTPTEERRLYAGFGEVSAGTADRLPG